MGSVDRQTAAAGSPGDEVLASGASLWASRNLQCSGIRILKAEIGLFAESRLAPRTID
jgi:hypothetical protein